MRYNTDKQNNKLIKQIILTAMVVLLCLVFLVSATIGLFTSSDESFIRVSSADVKMDLLQADDAGDYVSIKGSDGKVFGDQVWEPGMTKVVFIRVKSDSNINVKYALRLNVVDSALDGAFECFAYESSYFDTTGLSYKAIKANTTPIDMSTGLNVLSGSDFIFMKPGEAHDYALVLHMKESCGNEYQGKVCTVDINVLAAQGNATEGDLN